MKWRTDWVRSVALRLARVITCLYGFNPFNYIINGVTPSKAQCKTRGPEKYYARDLCVRPNDQRAESVAVTSKLLDHALWLDRWHSNIWAGSRRITDWNWFSFSLVSAGLSCQDWSCISSNEFFCPFFHQDLYKDNIMAAIEDFHKHTCIKFKVRTNERNWIKFRKDKGWV